MEGNYKPYNFVTSFGRIDEILAAPAGNFEEKDYLPSRDNLTFKNGYYAKCTALFVDIRDSSGLTQTYTRPVLAKIYRSFISEAVAILNSETFVREVNIVGDCVWAVYNTSLASEIELVMNIAAKLNSLIPVLNYKLDKRGYETPIKVGIGVAYGRALMIKAGYSGSGINDVIYMGDVVNSAAHLAGVANKTWQYKSIVVDGTIRENLTTEHQGWFQQVGWTQTYTGEVIWIPMRDWYDANCT